MLKTPFAAETKMEKCASPPQIWVQAIVREMCRLAILTRGTGRYKCLNLHKRLFTNMKDSQG